MINVFAGNFLSKLIVARTTIQFPGRVSVCDGVQKRQTWTKMLLIVQRTQARKLYGNEKSPFQETNQQNVFSAPKQWVPTQRHLSELLLCANMRVYIIMFYMHEDLRDTVAEVLRVGQWCGNVKFQNQERSVCVVCMVFVWELAGELSCMSSTIACKVFSTFPPFILSTHVVLSVPSLSSSSSPFSVWVSSSFFSSPSHTHRYIRSLTHTLKRITSLYSPAHSRRRVCKPTTRQSSALFC